MKEINLCKQLGCLGECCKNITIFDAEEVILKTFPDAIEVNACELKEAIDGKLRDGVYYKWDGDNKTEGMVIARIVGSCPYLLSNGDCSRHDRCSHAAINFEVGSKECNSIRERIKK